MAFTARFNGVEESTSVLIIPSSEIVIKGKTNVNSFDCQYNVLKLKEPIPVNFKRYNDKIIFDKTVLALESAHFDCGGSGINSDFNKLLKTKTYPKVFIELKEISKDTENDKLINASVNVEIAGIVKPYIIPVKLQGDEILNIEGILSLNILDFNLDPPKKALGIIIVKEIIDISFHLQAKEY
jgi:hypothetical protein